MPFLVPRHLPPAGPDLLVALDVDGTIMSHAGEVSDRVLGAVRALADVGTRVVIATGRGIVATTPVLDALDLWQGYSVCSNGAFTLRLGPGRELEILEAVTFHPEQTLRKLRRVLPDALFLVEDAHMGRLVTSPFPNGELHGKQRVVDFEELCQVRATRVTLRAPELEVDHIHEALERAGLHGVSYAVGWTAWLDVAPEGVSKASALERVREHLGISPFATVAVGDGANDHEMFDWASWGVAMGQALDETKAHADHVTGTVEEDGLAWVLEGLLER